MNKQTYERTYERTNEPTYERTSQRMNERTYKQTSEQTNKRTYERTNVRTNKRTNERTNEQTNVQTYKLTNKWTNVQMNERMNKQTYENLKPWCRPAPLGQGSEKWIAQIAALLDKMPSVVQIRFRKYGKMCQNTKNLDKVKQCFFLTIAKNSK